MTKDKESLISESLWMVLYMKNNSYNQQVTLLNSLKNKW
jgi:hypothetical protein